MRPVYPLSPRRAVPDNILKPDYAETGIPLSEQNIRSSSPLSAFPKVDIDALRKVCKVSNQDGVTQERSPEMLEEQQLLCQKAF